MRIGVSGCGFIGSSLINLLLEQGHSIVALDNRFKENLDSIIPFCTNDKFEFVLADITDENHVKKFYAKGLDFVVATAAIVGFPACDRYRDLAYAVNVNGMNNLIKYKPKEVGLIFTSTGSVYKPGQDVCTELSEVDPPSFYGRTKLTGEQIVRLDRRSIIHRYGTACGVGFSTLRVNLLMNDLVFKAVHDHSITIFEGAFKRVFINVLDLISAISVSLDKFDDLLDDGNRIYNVANNNMNISKIGLARLIQEKTNCHIVEADIGKDKDQRDYGYDSSKFMKKTGWKPVVDFDKTLDDLIKVSHIITPWNRYN